MSTVPLTPAEQLLFDSILRLEQRIAQLELEVHCLKEGTEP